MADHRWNPLVLRVLALVAPIMVVAACEPTSGDTPSGLVSLDGLPQLTLVEQTRIGSQADPELGFSAIGSVEVDRDGNVFLFETRDLQIRVYSQDGEPLRRLGGAGDGPGEFASSAGAFGLFGDTVWVYDGRANRLTLFKRTGQLLATSRVEEVRAPLHSSEQWAAIWPLQIGKDGLLIGERGTTFLVSAQLGTATVDTVQIPRVRFDMSGEVVDTIGTYPLARSPSTEFLDVGSSRYTMPRLPGADQIVTPVPDGLIIVDQPGNVAPHAIRVMRRNHDGEIVIERNIGYEPRSFPSALLDSTVARSTRSGTVMVLTAGGVERIDRNPEDSVAAVREISERLDFAARQYPVRSVRVASDGSLWLQREHQDDLNQRWTVLASEDYLPIGELQLAENQRIAWTDGETVWMVERDDFDVPWLVRYAIVGP